MTEVFISYARSTETVARAAAAALRSVGFGVWFDDDLPTHRPYAEVIEEQLGAAKAVVVIWSAEAVRSQWVRSEADRARTVGKLVQFTVDGARPPMPFDQVQCAVLDGWSGEAGVPAWRKVVASIAALVGRPPGDSPAATGEAPLPAPPAAPQRRVLAVLPLDNPSEDPEIGALCDGLSEDVIQAMTGRATLTILGRTASFAFRGAQKEGAAGRLGATHFVDGSIRRSGNRVRIAVHLIEASSGVALWAGRYDRDMSDSFAVQDEIAGLIGEAVALALPEAPVPAAPPHSGEGERRHVTVLACGFSAAGAEGGLDPEQWRAMAARLQPQAARDVERMGGQVARARSDGLVAYFGFPQAQEDAAERAVRAGLAILCTAAALDEDLAKDHGARISVRIGLDAGTVVIGGAETGEAEVFGDAPRIAAAAQAAAPAGAVVATELLCGLLGDRFLFEDANPGIAPSGEALPLRRIAGPARAQEHTRAAHRLTKFVGREEEMRLLLGRWERVGEGEGQSVLVAGEPGMGKSRLIEAFGDHIGARDHLWLACAGAAVFAQTPFHGVTQMLGVGLGWQGEESAEERLAGLERSLRSSGARLEEAVPLLAGLLDLPTPQAYAALPFAPDQSRQRLLGALAAWVFGLAAGAPVVLVVEDLQWVDPSTVEFLQILLDQGATAPLMLLLTSRPEFHAPWPAREHHARINLSRLSPHQSRELVEDVASRAGLSTEVTQRVLERTDGVPLFAEELTKLMLERAGREGAHEIPETLLDSLAARLDRLGRARETAQLASVLGREFTFSLLRAVSPLAEADLRSDLARLGEAEIIFARGLPPEATYRFKHALMQDAAYEALLKSRRRKLHARVAQTLCDQFSSLAATQSEVLARHWTEAGEAEPAVEAWRRAAEAAVSRRAFKEAEQAYGQALVMLETLPETEARDARELALRSDLNRVLQMTRGYAAPETVQAAARAKALAEKSGALSQVIREEAALWRAIITSGDYAAAAALADHILDLAGHDGRKPGRLIFAYNAQVQTRFYTGDLAGVEEHFAHLSPLIDDLQLRQAPGNSIIALGVASVTAWAMGRPATARARMERGIAFAERTGNPYDLAMSLHFQSLLHVFAGEVDPGEAAAESLRILANENGFSYAHDLALSALGWARARRGALADGVELIRRSLRARVETGALVGITSTYDLLAEAQALAGARENALATLEEALEVNPQERAFLPQTLRRRGEIRHQLGQGERAEADFRESMRLAAEMGAVTAQLRAAVSLGRLLLTRGAESADIEALVRPSRARFTDGSETGDLADADALLADLAQPPP